MMSRLSAICVIGWAIASNPALAHQVQTSQDVGGTIHIEPNDTPRAGEPSLTWFALTRPGGAAIPLSACECQLAVYAQTDNTLVPSPPLATISAEGYSDIPAAEITFPAVGAYELVLTGSPSTEGDFQPFELRFDVTVATATLAADPASENSVSPSTETGTGITRPESAAPRPPFFRLSSMIVPIALAGLGLMGLFTYLLRRKS